MHKGLSAHIEADAAESGAVRYKVRESCQGRCGYLKSGALFCPACMMKKKRVFVCSVRGVKSAIEEREKIDFFELI